MVEIKYVPSICPYCGTGCGINFVVKDGKIITAAGMGVAVEFGLELVATLFGKARADELRRAVIAD